MENEAARGIRHGCHCCCRRHVCVGSMAAAARCSRPDLVTSSVSVSVTVPGRQLNGRRQAAPREGSARPGWLTGVVWGVSWWFLAVAGSWGSALGHESDPPWPFEQPRCNPPRVENSHGPVDLAGVTDLSAGRSFAGARRYGADQVISLDGLLQWWSPLFLSRSRRPDHLPHTCPISPSRASGYLQMFTLDTAVCLLLSYSWVSDCGRRFTPSRHAAVVNPKEARRHLFFFLSLSLSIFFFFQSSSCFTSICPYVVHTIVGLQVIQYDANSS